MSKRKMSKQTKRRIFIFGTASILLIAYFIFSLMLYTFNIYKLKEKEVNLSNNLNELKHNEKILNTEIDKLKDIEYIARFARENYSYSKDGEIIIKMNDKENNIKIQKNNNIDYEKSVKYGIIIILFILFYVIIKSRKKKTKKKK